VLGAVIRPWPANRRELAIQTSDLADLIRAGPGKLEMPFQYHLVYGIFIAFKFYEAAELAPEKSPVFKL
jgi:hypothetical protein